MIWKKVLVFCLKVLPRHLRVRWAGCITHHREMRKVYRILVGKVKGKRPVGKSRHRQKDIES
jgi:hypothetical protein